MLYGVEDDEDADADVDHVMLTVDHVVDHGSGRGMKCEG
jgi:hypothetical protein